MGKKTALGQVTGDVTKGVTKGYVKAKKFKSATDIAKVNGAVDLCKATVETTSKIVDEKTNKADDILMYGATKKDVNVDDAIKAHNTYTNNFIKRKVTITGCVCAVLGTVATIAFKAIDVYSAATTTDDDKTKKK